MPEYQYSKIDYPHPDPKLRPHGTVSVTLQMDYDEIVAGVSIEVRA